MTKTVLMPDSRDTVVPASMLTSLATGSRDELINSARSQVLHSLLRINGAVSGQTPVSVADSMAVVRAFVDDLQSWTELCKTRLSIDFPTEPLVAKENPYGNLELFVTFDGRERCLATLHSVDILDNGNRAAGLLTQTFFRLLRVAPTLFKVARDSLADESGERLDRGDLTKGDALTSRLLDLVEFVEGSAELKE